MKDYCFPTFNEIRAIERAARRARAEAIARLFAAAWRNLAALIASGAASLAEKTRGAGPARRTGPAARYGA